MPKQLKRKRQIVKRTKRKPKTRNRSIPAARTSTNRSTFQQRQLDNTTIRVSGYDLIYNLDDVVVDGPFCVLPANPAYWTGTRVANIASSYAQFRPLKLEFCYHPQVSTMTSGNVVVGTLWNNTSGGTNTRQTLATSNGGRIFPIYQPATVPIQLKSNLQKNLYDFQGYLGSDSNPFVFIALSQHANNIVPGYFMVRYVYDFKNPLGEGNDYDTDVTLAGDVKQEDVWDNTTALLLTETTLASIGTELIVKVIDNAVQFFLGGSRIGVLADCLVKLFKNRPKTQSQFQDDLEDLSQSNTLEDAMINLVNIENGSSVTIQFHAPFRITMDDLIPYNTYKASADVKKAAGFFFVVRKIGLGRYNVGLLALATTSENIPDDYYVLKTRTVVPDYSVILQTHNVVEDLWDLQISGPIIKLMSALGGAPVVCELEVYNYLPPGDEYIQWIGDIALEDAQTALGVNVSDIVGTGNSTLVPTRR